jgi:hypothetical protein
MGVREENVTQKGADPRNETRIIRLSKNRKNLIEECFHPVTEYRFTLDQL